MRLAAALFALLLAMPVSAQPAPPAQAQKAFPGAAGWAAVTPGGRGGRILRVTTLAADGPGSFKAAVETSGPRIVVFEVGGVIDMGRTTLTIAEPFLTIAGQTAPSPGITLIRGGIDLKAHDVIVRHIRIRTGVDGQARMSGWEADAFSTVGAYNVIVDHCTMTWGLRRESLGLGPALHRRRSRRSGGATPRTTSPSATICSPKGWPMRATPRASIRRDR